MFVSNNVLRSVFEINEQLSSTCFIGSKGLTFVPAPAHTGCLSWLCNHSLDITRKNHPAERIIPGGPRSTRLLYRGRISFFCVIKFSVQSRTTVSCTRRKISPFGKKSACRRTGSGYPRVIFVNPRWGRHAGHGLAGGGGGDM